MSFNRWRPRMTIRTHVVAVALGVFALLAGLQYLVQREMLLPHFAQIERDEAYAAMDRVSYALSRELNTFTTSARDWGNWIESYDYIQGRSPAFVETNVNADALRVIHAGVIVFVSPDARVHFSAAFDQRSGNPIASDFLADGYVHEGDPLRAALGGSKSVTGLVRTNRGPMLVATAPVMNGTGKGPIAGMLVLGRFLAPAELAAAANVRPSALRAILAPERPAGITPASARDPGASPYDGVLETEGTTYIYRDLRDLSGRTVATLRLAAAREISESARHTIAVATLCLVVFGALALVLLLLYLNRAVLAPLSEITVHATHIGTSDDLSRRLDRTGHDELAHLAQAFDQMVARLAQTRSDLIEQSFGAGIAEMASGALHNLGNALTPLAVRVSALDSALRRAPAEDMGRVARELAGPVADPARRADLEQFAVLAGSELAEAVVRSRADAEAAARQLQSIQRILTDQVRQSRAGAVLESVSMSALLAQSVELVAPDKRARLLVQIDPGVEAITGYRLPATVLRQVFQNLIVNAAEAMPARAGVLAIHAEVVRDAGLDLLVCRFRDDGAGISPDVLPRLFQRQFSTKSTDTNSGIGLHWCANALRRLGGEIRVTSDGPGTGACFHVVVPVKAEQTIDTARAA